MISLILSSVSLLHSSHTMSTSLYIDVHAWTHHDPSYSQLFSPYFHEFIVKWLCAVLPSHPCRPLISSLTLTSLSTIINVIRHHYHSQIIYLSSSIHYMIVAHYVHLTPDSWLSCSLHACLSLTHEPTIITTLVHEWQIMSPLSLVGKHADHTIDMLHIIYTCCTLEIAVIVQLSVFTYNTSHPCHPSHHAASPTQRTSKRWWYVHDRYTPAIVHIGHTLCIHSLLLTFDVPCKCNFLTVALISAALHEPSVWDQFEEMSDAASTCTISKHYRCYWCMICHVHTQFNHFRCTRPCSCFACSCLCAELHDTTMYCQIDEMSYQVYMCTMRKHNQNY